MGHKEYARPAAWRHDERAENRDDSVSSDCSTALALHERSKLCNVAKIVTLDNELVLAIVHRHQSGVQTTISVPVVALRYAEQRSVQTLVFRRDIDATMYRISLNDLRKVGWLATSESIAEYFIKISSMQPCTWRAWEYAERVTVLDEKQKQQAERQLSLFSERAT